MRSVIGFDTETHLGEGEDCPCGTRHYTATPPWVCSSLAGGPETREAAEQVARALCSPADVFVITLDDGSWGMVLTGTGGVQATSLILSLSDINAAHYAGYDVGILANEDPGYIKSMALDLGYDGAPHRLRCTMLREQTIATALDKFYGAQFGLAEVVMSRLNVDISGDKKNPDSWRLRYALLDGQPVGNWPEKAVEYALMDAVYARLVYLSQARPLKVDGNVVVNDDGDVAAELLNSRMAIAVMPWMRCRGVRVDPKVTREWIAEVTAEANRGTQLAHALGIIRVNRCTACDGRGFTGSYPLLSVCPVCLARQHEACLAARVYTRKATTGVGSEIKSAKQDLVSWMYNGHPPRTAASKTFPHGQISTSDDAFEQAEQTTPLIEEYQKTLFAKKQLSTYVPFTLAAAERPGNTLWSWPNPVVTTNRTSWAKPNLTNPPRAGRYRECHIPREGMVMCSLDFSSNELRTHAQYNLDTFGVSRMAEVLNDPNGDVYLDFAANTMGISYEEAVRRKEVGDKEIKANRQTHKIAVLGYPGGLGANSFIGFARGYGLSLDKDTAQRLKKDWMSTYPEMALHLQRISELSDLARGGKFTMTDPRSGWVKGGCNFTSAANFVFQCSGAHVLKSASWECWLGCYVDEESPLYKKAHLLITIHDEIVMEGCRDSAHEWAHDAARRMVAAAEVCTPDVRHFVEPALMDRWLKQAEPVYQEGRLVPWTPTEK